MPFTPSHMAAAIPFFRTRLVPSALMIGCMAPDFEYFLRFEAAGGFGHTLSGIFLFDLPVSFIALWLFHAYAKEPLYAWLPANFRRRIQLGPAALPGRNARDFALVVISILVGVCTHILWDSFTHRSFWPYAHWWWYLHQTVTVPLWGKMEHVRVIQHVSTIIGALALFLWVYAWYRRTEPVHDDQVHRRLNNRRSVLVAICVLSLFLAALRTLLGVGVPADRNDFLNFLGDAVITTITTFWLQVVIYGFFRVRMRRQWQSS